MARCGHVDKVRLSLKNPWPLATLHCHGYARPIDHGSYFLIKQVRRSPSRQANDFRSLEPRQSDFPVRRNDHRFGQLWMLIDRNLEDIARMDGILVKRPRPLHAVLRFRRLCAQNSTPKSCAQQSRPSKSTGFRSEHHNFTALCDMSR